MNRLLPIVSIAGLVLVILPAVAYLVAMIEKDTMVAWMLVGTVIWFVSAPTWMAQKPVESTHE